KAFTQEQPRQQRAGQRLEQSNNCRNRRGRGAQSQNQKRIAEHRYANAKMQQQQPADGRIIYNKPAPQRHGQERQRGDEKKDGERLQRMIAIRQHAPANLKRRAAHRRQKGKKDAQTDVRAKIFTGLKADEENQADQRARQREIHLRRQAFMQYERGQERGKNGDCAQCNQRRNGYAHHTHRKDKARLINRHHQPGKNHHTQIAPPNRKQFFAEQKEGYGKQNGQRDERAPECDGQRVGLGAVENAACGDANRAKQNRRERDKEETARGV